MRGVLVSLTEQSVDKTIEYLKFMHQNGFDSIFTSLQIPEEDPSALLDPLSRIGGFAGDHDMMLMVDVSPRTFRHFSIPELRESGVTGLRIDTGMENSEISALTQDWLVALNASTIDEAFLADLRELQADFSSLEAWHNYYPRPETGLEWDSFKKKNEWLQSQGLTVAAFIPGDGELRGPLHEGLPTLEQHRHQSPFASYLELQYEAAVDHVVIGDLSVSEWTMQQFISWNEGTVVVGVRDQRPSHIWKELHHNRPDIARDVIRSEDARSYFNGSIEPDNCVERPIGTLTLDNDNYKRYKGEFQVVLKPLPADDRVNVIGYVIDQDLPLMSFLQKYRYPFKLLVREPRSE
ncbi:MAG TPA: MupG family TIM beta-alpha barrel fold protein [Paenibacillus sp.]